MGDESKVKRLGAYAKLSATYYRDDSLLRAGDQAEVLFTRGLAFCAEASSDGYITDLQVTHVVGIGLKALQKRLDALVNEGVWEKVDGGYVVRSWLKWNRSAAEVGMVKKKDRERKRSDGNPDGIPPDSGPGLRALPSESLSETGQDRTSHG